jgi:hypothetical protein
MAEWSFKYPIDQERSELVEAECTPKQLAHSDVRLEDLSISPLVNKIVE